MQNSALSRVFHFGASTRKILCSSRCYTTPPPAFFTANIITPPVQILKKVFSLPFQSEVGGFHMRMFRCCRACPHTLTLRLGGFIAAVRSGNRVGKHGTDGREPKSVGHGASSPTLFNGAGDRSPDVTSRPGLFPFLLAASIGPGGAPRM